VQRCQNTHSPGLGEMAEAMSSCQHGIGPLLLCLLLLQSTAQYSTAQSIANDVAKNLPRRVMNAAKERTRRGVTLREVRFDEVVPVSGRSSRVDMICRRCNLPLYVYPFIVYSTSINVFDSTRVLLSKRNFYNYMPKSRLLCYPKQVSTPDPDPERDVFLVDSHLFFIS